MHYVAPGLYGRTRQQTLDLIHRQGLPVELCPCHQSFYPPIVITGSSEIKRKLSQARRYAGQRRIVQVVAVRPPRDGAPRQP